MCLSIAGSRALYIGSVTPGTGLQRSDAAQIRRFGERLLEAGITATIRKTRGDDIDAACGQLAGEVINITKRRPSLAHRTIS